MEQKNKEKSEYILDEMKTLKFEYGQKFAKVVVKYQY